MPNSKFDALPMPTMATTAMGMQGEFVKPAARASSLAALGDDSFQHHGNQHLHHHHHHQRRSKRKSSLAEPTGPRVTIAGVVEDNDGLKPRREDEKQVIGTKSAESKKQNDKNNEPRVTDAMYTLKAFLGILGLYALLVYAIGSPRDARLGYETA